MSQQRPQLVPTPTVKGRSGAYKCSSCGRVFILPEVRNPKEAMPEVRAAFDDHVREVHAAEADA